MADPITWRSINAPDFRASASSMAGAAETFKDAFGGLRNTLKEYDVAEEKFATKRTKDNTAAYLTHLASIQDPAAAEAALKSGQLTEMLRGYGSEIDAPTAIAAQQSLLPNLQQRAVQAMQFEQEGQKMKDYRTDLGQRDTVAGLQEALLRASNPDEVNRIKQALGIYQSQGYVDNRAGVDIIKNAAAREGTLVNEGRAAEKHLMDKTKMEADLKNQQARLGIDRAQLGISQQNANTSAIQAAGNLALSVGGKAASIVGEYSKEANKIQERAQEFEKNSPFGGQSFEKVPLKTYMDIGKSVGADQQDIGQFLQAVREKFPSGAYKPPNSKTAVPITDQMIQQAIASGAATSAWNPSTWLNGRNTEMMDVLTSMVESPSFVQSYEEYLNRKTLYETQSKAVKENGVTATNALERSVAPYLDRLQSKAGVAPPKR